MKRKAKEFWYRLVTGVLIGLTMGGVMLALIYLVSGFLSLIFGGLL